MRIRAILATATLLAFPIALGVPAVASAATVVTNFTDLQNAVTAGDAQISLGADITAGSGDGLDLGSHVVTLDLDGHDLTISHPASGSPGISLPSGSALTIDDSVGSGKLDAVGGDLAAGVGGGVDTGGGTLTLNGGTITITGGAVGAGIGGGENGSGGTTTINGGTLTIVGGEEGAGIGGSENGSGGTTTINGGTLTIVGGDDAAGIGGGQAGDGGNVTITGGTMSVIGGESGAGIGGGETGRGGDVVITGGSISVTGGEFAAGIGGGEFQPHAGTADIQGTPTSGSGTDGGSSTNIDGGGAPIYSNSVEPTGVSYTATSIESVGGSTTILFHYTVTIDPGNGDPPSTQTIDYGGAATAPSTPSRPGYEFVGWDSGGVPFSFATVITGPITVDAVWHVVLATTGVDPGLSGDLAVILLLVGMTLLFVTRHRATPRPREH